MKKIIKFIIALTILSFLASCSSNEPADLTGEWKQVNSNSSDSWQSASIDNNTITIFWVSNNGDTKALYWAGTYIAPDSAELPYSWDSLNDHNQTDSALLASSDDIKKITFDKNQLSYSVSAFGVTTTVYLEKQ